MNQDSLLEYYSRIEDLRKNDHSFALATVVKVIGAASARVGSKAIFDENGKNIFGWVGGGCAERFVGDQSVEAITERKGRIVLADLDDEIFGLGVACGGKMEVFIDPVTPMEKVSLLVNSKLHKEVQDFAKGYALKIQMDGPGKEITNIKDFFVALTKTLAKQRNKTGKHLREVKDLPFNFTSSKPIQKTSRISILGHGRITEALGKHFTTLGFQVHFVSQKDLHNVQYQPNEIVLIASHTSRDPQLVKEAIAQNASYIGMVGSRKRVFEVINHLQVQEGFKIEFPLYIPCGMDMDARNPDEIALSMAAEIIQLMDHDKWI